VRIIKGVSIIIPNRNGVAIISDVLHSLRNQRNVFFEYEIIVVDDASRDSSVAHIESHFPEATIICNTRRRGAAHCKNSGIAHASHTWLLFLDNDTILPDDFLSNIPAVITRYPFTHCFQPKILFADDSNTINSAGGVANIYGYAWDRGIYEQDNAQFNLSEEIFFASTAAMIVHKKVLEQSGIFDPAYNYLNEDVDLGYRIHMIGQAILYAPELTCYHRMSSTMGRNNATVKYLMERNRIMTVLKNYEWRTLRHMGFAICKGKVKKYVIQMREGKNTPWSFIGAAVACWLWLIVHLPLIMYKRWRVQRKRMCADADIFNLMGNYRAYFPVFSKSKSAYAPAGTTVA